MKALAVLLLLLFAGCTGIWEPGTVGGGVDIKKLCDKSYPKDSQEGTITGVYRCGEEYRLVFDSPAHPDYYITLKGEFFTSCPLNRGNEDCSALLEKCKENRFINLCR
ncbi:MAG: hypothetical protein V1909_01180 [Candidatus Micrarchaeota archaeon]